MASIFRTGAFHMVRLVSYKTQNIDEWDAQPRAWHGTKDRAFIGNDGIRMGDDDKNMDKTITFFGWLPGWRPW